MSPLDRWVFSGLLLWILWAITYLAPGAQFVAGAGFALLCVDVVAGRRSVSWGGSVGRWLLVLLGIGCLSVLTSIWLGRSVATVQRLLLNVLFFLFVVNALQRTSQVRLAVFALVVLMALFPALGAIREFLAQGGRADWQGLFGSPNDLAATLALVLPLAIAWRRFEQRGWTRRVAELSTLLLIGGVLVTGSRSGTLALLVVAGWAVWTARRRVVPILLGLLLLVGAEVSGSLQVSERVSSMFAYGVQGQAASIEDEDLSNWTNRKRIWGVAIDAVFERPLLGMGPGTFEEVHTRYASPSITGGGSRWVDTHNSFLRVWSEMGTLGLIAFLGVCLSAVTHGRRWYRRGKRTLGEYAPSVQMMAGATIGLVAFLVSNIFNTFYDMWLMYLVLGLIVVLGRDIRRYCVQAGAANHCSGRQADSEARPIR